MPVLLMVAATSMRNAANADNMRGLLLILLVVAIGLILAGAVIALWTLYNHIKARSTNSDRFPEE
ncbi:hypothetical protein KDW_08170 [Dictyobacter vulcani]|uniref:Uncharacterized protein n=1 Tax=Dictyobacter vulcani TaxID=2607529 RepID=A0A5J4KGM2_9CHLR|nr:hypothetical protein [Dictyobacter vulcani]GER86655.1 hypothetical protein KDW_08170 [Dictyobacter vulcani]